MIPNDKNETNSHKSDVLPYYIVENDSIVLPFSPWRQHGQSYICIQDNSAHLVGEETIWEASTVAELGNPDPDTVIF